MVLYRCLVSLTGPSTVNRTISVISRQQMKTSRCQQKKVCGVLPPQQFHLKCTSGCFLSSADVTLCTSNSVEMMEQL